MVINVRLSDSMKNMVLKLSRLISKMFKYDYPDAPIRCMGYFVQSLNIFDDISISRYN